MSDGRKKEKGSKQPGKTQLPQDKPKPYPLRGALSGVPPRGQGLSIIRSKKEVSSEELGVVESGSGAIIIPDTKDKRKTKG